MLKEHIKGYGFDIINEKTDHTNWCMVCFSVVI
jgi:hypothetical protein